MAERSNTETNLDSITEKQDAERVPLTYADSFDSETTDESSSEKPSDPAALSNTRPKKLQKQNATKSSSSFLQRLPTLVSEQSVDSLRQPDVDRIFQRLSHQHQARLARNRRKGNIFKSGFEDLTVNPTRTTIFDSPEVKQSQFYGFYILFWLAVGFFIFNDFIHEVFQKGLFINGAPVFNILTSDLPSIVLADFLMYVTIYFAYFLQSLCVNGHICWSTWGWVWQSLYEVVWGCGWVFWIATVKLQWIGRVFLVMHSMVLLMKMHSYAFYNGYLWLILVELQFSENYKQRLDNKEAKVPDKFEKDKIHRVLNESIAFCKFELLLQSGALKADGKDDMDTVAMSETVERLTEEKYVKFPTNITFRDFFEYTMFPSVVYELVTARNNRIRWSFVMEKTLAIFGVIFLMLLVAEHQIYPLVMKANKLRSINMTLKERGEQYIIMLVDMIPPFMLEYLLVFFLIWDAILNAIGEISMYADRDFYGPWWSCTDWGEYARLWNKPVHRFLLRHVYHSSISAFSFNKTQAALTTFVISSIIHELVMYIIFGRLRGYLLLFQMGQIPLVMMSRTPFMRNKKVLGNVICWFGFVSGPAMICTLYLIF